MNAFRSTLQCAVAAAVCAASTLVCATNAQATASVAVVSKNCTSILSATGCEFTGNINGNSSTTNASSFLNAQSAFNVYAAKHTAVGGPIALHYLGDTGTSFPGTFTGAGLSLGTWSLPKYTVNFLGVKAGNDFVLYELSPGKSSGSWSTAQLGGKALSHLVFFGTKIGAVPEPATWVMMLLGLGFVGGAMRKRSTVGGQRQSVATA